MIIIPGVTCCCPLFDGDETTSEFTVIRSMRFGDIIFQFENRKFRIFVNDEVVHEMTLKMGQALAASLQQLAEQHAQEMQESERRVFAAMAELAKEGHEVSVSEAVVAAAQEQGIDLSSCVDTTQLADEPVDEQEVIQVDSSDVSAEEDDTAEITEMEKS